MTRLSEATTACRVCGTESKHTVLLSSNTFSGLPDLDNRPAEMLRGTMYTWVQRCPSCGFCAMYLSHDHQYDLPVAPTEGHEGIWAAPAEPASDSPARATSSERREVLRSLVGSERYVAQLRDPLSPRLANSFLCQSLIDEAEGRYVDATFGALHAAWACDDARASGQATASRRRAAELIRDGSGGSQAFGIRLRTRPALRADALRRCGDFESAAAECRAGLADEPEQFLQNVLHFQVELISRRDVAAHSLAEAIRSAPEAWGLPGTSRSESPKKGAWRFWRR